MHGDQKVGLTWNFENISLYIIYLNRSQTVGDENMIMEM